MNKNRYKHAQELPLRMKSAHPKTIDTFSKHIQAQLNKHRGSKIILCIGTDRSTGDALGPLTGMLLEAQSLQHFEVYGTIDNPVHATNLIAYLEYIKQTYENPFIIAIDASLGRQESIGYLTCGIGAIQPGAAFQKALPAVGDIHLTGVVNVNGHMGFEKLQSTRLALVYQMATVLSDTLSQVDRILYPIQEQPNVLWWQKFMFWRTKKDLLS